MMTTKNLQKLIKQKISKINKICRIKFITHKIIIDNTLLHIPLKVNSNFNFKYKTKLV